MKLDELVEKLDLEKVTQAIELVEEGRPKLRDYDLEDARRMVRAVIEKWLLKDRESYELEGVEEEFTYEVGAMGAVRGVLDLRLRKDGAVVILDWKTSRNTLDEEWKRRLMDSWQWKIYAVVTGAKQVMYRGIGRPHMEKGLWKCETRQLLWDVPEENQENVLLYLEGMLGMRSALVDMGMKVWPRSMPGACMAFGQMCPFIQDCRKNTMPLGVVKEKVMSYTQFERLALCPERHRRMLMMPQIEESDEASLGKAVHRGLAEVYKQVWQNEK